MIPKFHSGRTVLVGDAAGMVNPLSGEGIYYAFKAARLLAGSFKNGSLATTAERVSACLSEYQRNFNSEFGNHLKSCHLARKMMSSPTMSKLILGAASHDPEIRKQGVNLMFGNGTISPSMIARLMCPRRNQKII